MFELIDELDRRHIRILKAASAAAIKDDSSERVKVEVRIWPYPESPLATDSGKKHIPEFLCVFCDDFALLVQHNLIEPGTGYSTRDDGKYFGGTAITITERGYDLLSRRMLRGVMSFPIPAKWKTGVLFAVTFALGLAADWLVGELLT